jgi:Condensation domain
MVGRGGQEWRPSYGQIERLEVSPDRTRRNDLVRFGVRLDGPLDLGRLECAVAEIASVHPILTGYFACSFDGYLFQTGRWPARLDVFNGPFPSDYYSPEEGIPAVVKGPLFRLGLARLGRQEHEVLLIADHTIMDFRSVTLCLNGIFRAYEGKVGAPPGASFGWWTGWERNYFHLGRMERDLDFWRRQLSECGPLPACGFASENSAAPGAFSEQQYRVDHSRAEAVRRYAKRSGLAEFTFLSILWKCAQYLVKRFLGEAGDRELASSYGAMPNRLTPSIWWSLGGFANSGVIVSEIEASRTLHELHMQEDRQYLLASAHQGLPHGYVLRDLAPELYGIRYAESAAIPAYLNFDMPGAVAEPLVAPKGLILRQGLSLPPDPPRGGIRVIVGTGQDGWILNARFRSSLYSPERLHFFAKVWSELLDWWLFNPDARLQEAVSCIAARLSL